MIHPRVLFSGDPAAATPWVGIAKKLARECYNLKIASKVYKLGSGVNILVKNIFPTNDAAGIGISKVWIEAGKSVYAFLLHPMSSTEPYGWIRYEGEIIAKLDEYLISRGNMYVDENGFVSGYDEEYANSILVCDKLTGAVKSLKLYQEVVSGNQFAYLHKYIENSEKYIITNVMCSWWHSASGDGPIHEFIDNHPFYPASAVPSYVPYVKNIDSDYYIDEYDYYKVRLYYRSPNNVEYIIPPQLYVNGKLVYIHGDLEDPQGFFAGVHVVSSTRLLAVYVSGRNKMGESPYTTDLLRYDTAELLDINISIKTVTVVGTVALNKFYVDGKVRMTWPFRFSQDGSKVANIQKMGNLYTSLYANPLANYLNYTDGDFVWRDARCVVTNNIIYDGENDSYSTNLDTETVYTLDAENDIDITITTTTWPVVINSITLYEGDSIEDYSMSGVLYGSFSIPYALNYIQNALTFASIEFSNSPYTYDFTYLENHRRWEAGPPVVMNDWYSLNSVQPLPVIPTLTLRGNEYELYYPTIGYEELTKTYLSSGTCTYISGVSPIVDTNATSGETRISPPKLNISYINIIDDVLVLTGRSVSQEVYFWSYGSVGDSGVYSENKTANSLKLDYFSINDDVLLDTADGILNLPITVEREVDYGTYGDWYTSEDFDSRLDAAYNYAFYSFNNSRSTGTDTSSNHTNIQFMDFIGNSIYSAIKIAVDSRLDTLSYVYKIDWPETDIVIDWGPPEVTETFAEIRQAGSNLKLFDTKIREIPGTSPSFDMIGLI